MNWLLNIVSRLREVNRAPTLDEVRRQRLEFAQLDLVLAAERLEDARAAFDALKSRVQRLERELAHGKVVVG